MTSPDLAPFQEGGHAWSPLRPDIVDLLRDARHCTTRPIYYGSNHTFLVTLHTDEAGQSHAVYKPAKGEYPLYDFPAGTLYRREVGTWHVDRVLGWNVVPPTVVSRGQYGVGSLQLFIESHPTEEIEMIDLERIALLDLIVNNADRKAEHCLPGGDGRVWAIDHGLTFHAQPKLRTVLWHFAGESIPRKEWEDLERLARTLRSGKGEDARALSDLISRSEMRALQDRTQRLVDAGKFPDPRYKAVPYRW